jgi:hypothetical protein
MKKGPPKRVTWHEPPWFPPVVAFYKGSQLRETYAQWWSPHWNSDLGDVLHAIGPRGSSTPEGLEDCFGRGRLRKDWKSPAAKTINVAVEISAYLSEKQSRVVQVSSKRFGEVFGVAHDLYADVYKRDDAEWKKAGKGRVPTAGEQWQEDVKAGKVTKKEAGFRTGLVNRARGRLVWGHEMGDLSFEGLHFEPSDVVLDWLKRYYDARVKMMTKARKKNPGVLVLAGPKAKDLPKLVLGKSDVIGTITFGIGS